jgi:hypothetical protein
MAFMIPLAVDAEARDAQEFEASNWNLVATFLAPSISRVFELWESSVYLSEVVDAKGREAESHLPFRGKACHVDIIATVVSAWRSQSKAVDI